MKKNWLWRSLFLLIWSSICASCKLGQIEQMSPLDSLLKEYALKANDLPEGWIFTGEDWGVDFGGSGYTVSYEFKTDPSILLSNTIAIYSDQEKSNLAYQQWEDLWFESTQLWPEATYSPQSQQDDCRFECLNALVGSSILSCRYLQRHDNIIGFVKVRFDNESLTFTDLNRMLSILDKRLNDIGIKDGDVSPSP